MEIEKPPYRKLGQEGAELAGHPATPSHCWAPQKKWTWWWKPAASAHFPRSHRPPTPPPPPTPVQGHCFQRYHSPSTSSLMNPNQSSQHSTQHRTRLQYKTAELVLSCRRRLQVQDDIDLFQWLCVVVPGEKGAAKAVKVRYQQGLVYKSNGQSPKAGEQKMRFLL